MRRLVVVSLSVFCRPALSLAAGFPAGDPAPWYVFGGWFAAVLLVGFAFVSLVLYVKDRRAGREIRARFDEQTGLPNRTKLISMLQKSLRRAKATGRGLSVLLLDLDDFERVNETFGKAAADQVLSGFVVRLQLAMKRDCDLARLGGDRFVALVPHEDSQRVEQLLHRIRDICEEPVAFGGGAARVTVSIGVAQYLHHRLDARTLLPAADAALLEAKRAGKDAWRLFSMQQALKSKRRGTTRKSWLAAFDRQEFVLHYQRKISLSTGRVTGYEALLRQRSANGIRGASEVLAEAEQSGLIAELNEWVIRSAARQSLEWRKAGFVAPISVNVSGEQLRDTRLVRVMKALADEDPGLPPLLALEIPASTFAFEDTLAHEVVARLHDLGFAIHLGNFVLSYADYARLARLPLKALKIDRRLMTGVPLRKESCEIVQNIVTLGRALRLAVVAEGIETEDQMLFLQASGCQEAQGFFFDYPLPPEEVLKRSFATPRG